jgi:hypothetical protein
MLGWPRLRTPVGPSAVGRAAADAIRLPGMVARHLDPLLVGQPVDLRLLSFGMPGR